MISHESEAVTEPATTGTRGDDPAEDDDVHELQDHEFTLEVEDATIEMQSSAPPSARSVPPQPPLPRWAAASRALLDGWQKLLDVNGQATIEIPPPGAAPAAGSGKPSEQTLREKLAQLALQVHAREVYCREIERALVSASGRVRGQAFRIAELEAELLQFRSRFLPSDTEVTIELPARRARPTDDLRKIRGVGPRFAARLAALGVTSFETIANWSASDVTNVAKQLGVKRERLTEDSWVKQARALRKPRRRRKAR